MINKNKVIQKKQKKHQNRSQADKNVTNDSGIVVIDDNINENKDIEIEERKAYLEESRSQDAYD